MADYTPAQVAAIRQKAYEIAVRGVSSVTVADRTHRFSDPNLLEEFAQSAALEPLDDTYGGLVDVIFHNPT